MGVLIVLTKGQIGNPDGEDKPNKKNYDPRVWLRKAEEAMVRVMQPCCLPAADVCR
jgi:fructose/tagatose bisphosphate aldolase